MEEEEEGMGEEKRTKTKEDGGLVRNLRRNGRGRRGNGRGEAYENKRRWWISTQFTQAEGNKKRNQERRSVRKQEKMVN